MTPMRNSGSANKSTLENILGRNEKSSSAHWLEIFEYIVLDPESSDRQR